MKHHDFDATSFMLSKARDLSSGILNFECDNGDRVSLALDAEYLLDMAEQVVSAFAATHPRSNQVPDTEGVFQYLGYGIEPNQRGGKTLHLRVKVNGYLSAWPIDLSAQSAQRLAADLVG